ncbi:ABC transporter permease [Adhaeribacter radiodurans]|uniref:ABC transporter permease n=1 Tax=Adhaeribacter radiodurans TaxID=2745197 RepID=A0A7L7L1R6_9BACT|nr:ABC transporter permease [Adhaeribacter radiodurans]QMU26724.1 ABC transporter permease [Adhaeribacter radiodurans]
MFRNYFKIALRNLWRNKAFSAINIFGLAIGIATCLVIMLFVVDELSYDRFNQKADRIVRLVFKVSLNGETLETPTASAPTGQTLVRDYPEVEEATRVRVNSAPFITYQDKTFKEDKFAYVDANFFQVFTLPFIQGDAKTALREPNTIVITKAMAQKYFGTYHNAVGKMLQLKNEKTTYKVTGVIDKVPTNSHFHFNFFASMAGLEEARQTTWMSNNFNTYLVLRPGYDYKQLQAKLPQVIEKYMGPEVQKAMGMTLKQFREKGDDVGLYLQPLTDIHLRSNLNNDLEPGGDMRYVYIFGAIALFMLLIASINFMNLSTAGASKRAREVGIRKVLGSVKKELVQQFLLESILLTIIALVLGIVLVYLALPLFNDLAGKELALQFIANLWLIPALLLFGLIVGVLAGSYPAFFLSSFQPVKVLKGTLTAGKESLSLRSGLVVFQFFISVALMIGTTVVYQQLNYIQNKKIGFDKDQTFVLHDTYVLGKQEEVFRQQLLQDPRVVNASVSGFVPVGPTSSENSVVLPENNAAQSVSTRQYFVDHNYIPTLGMQIVAGRNFSKDFASDSTAMVINEAAAKAFGWGNNILGRKVSRFINNAGDKAEYRVIGVVKDFHFESLHQRITPLLMILGNNSGSIIVKAKTKDIAGLLTSMKQQWGSFTANAPFAYTFMDERFAETYQAEQKVGRILSIFSGLTIFVACLGLFGLATFTAEQRTKEIGIRKVLGASLPNIVSLLSKDFLKLVLIANLLAWPLAWWAMHQWLQDFEYRTTIGWWVFGLAGVGALLIALLTISYQAIKAAIANPVKSLRSE